MSYEPTNWKSGDIVTSAKLNKLEQGVANVGGALVVNVTTNSDGDKVCDKTAGEMVAALESGGIIFREYNDSEYDYTPLTEAAIVDGESYAFFAKETTYTATSASDYPTYIDR